MGTKRRYALFFMFFGLGFQATISGCCRQREEFSLDPYDYALAPRIIQQFFGDNPAGEVDIEAYCYPHANDRQPVDLDIDFETEATVLRALARDALPSGDPRGWCSCLPDVVLYLNGPHYSLYITLTGVGYAIGSEQAYCFTSELLSRALEKACAANGVLTANLRYSFKRGAGEDSVFPSEDKGLFMPP